MEIEQKNVLIFLIKIVLYVKKKNCKAEKSKREGECMCMYVYPSMIYASQICSMQFSILLT